MQLFEIFRQPMEPAVYRAYSAIVFGTGIIGVLAHILIAITR